MRHTFVDREYVQRIDNVTFVVHHPRKEQSPVLVPDRPWEGRSTDLWNPPIWCAESGRWRMWYYGGQACLPLYAESVDGIHWEKPNLRIVDWHGSLENNVIDLGLADRHGDERLVMLEDPDEKDPARRFKGLVRRSNTRRLVPIVSSDGLRFTPVPGNGVPTADEYRLGYDVRNKRFIASVKQLGTENLQADRYTVPEFGRSVLISLSDNFTDWTEPTLAFWADELDQELGRQYIQKVVADPSRLSPAVNQPEQYFTDVYNMPIFCYAGVYLGLPAMFNQTGLWGMRDHFGPGRDYTNQDGIVYPALVVSRDLLHWEYLSRTPFIEPSPLSNKESWDYGSLYAVSPILQEDELLFYYSGCRNTHTSEELRCRVGQWPWKEDAASAIFLARLRRDGFVSLQAGAEPGVMLTTPLTVTGSQLYVNADVRGELRVEVRDAQSGRVLPGYSLGDYIGSRFSYSADGQLCGPRMGTGARLMKGNLKEQYSSDDPDANDTVPFTGDSTSAIVQWNHGADVSALNGREVRLCFYLCQADLFSFWFSDDKA